MAVVKTALRVCLVSKKILLNRTTIKLLGSPTHLCFWYDETEGVLTFLPAAEDDLDAFEIPKHFWKSTKHSCEIARIAFLVALQEQIGWEDKSRYVYDGSIVDRNGIPSAVFELSNGTRIK